MPQDLHHDVKVDLELNFFYPHRLRLLDRAAKAYLMMNIDQQGIFDSILALCSEPGAIFVNSGIGQGKTFLLGAICDQIHGEGQVVYITGTIALSIDLYKHRQTAHSAFGIPV
jgi:type IV secretory pathway ATPase VirB11/archaellum biosynthesis ATPase